jgi:hypothetical protein
MSCEEADFRLGAYLDRELAGAEGAAVRRHLESCAPCRGALGRLERLEAVARDSARAPAVSAEDWARRRERAVAGARILRAGLGRVRWVAAAAAALLASAVALPLLLPAPAPRLPISMEPGANEVVINEFKVDGYDATLILPEDEDSSEPLVISLFKS